MWWGGTLVDSTLPPPPVPPAPCLRPTPHNPPSPLQAVEARLGAELAEAQRMGRLASEGVAAATAGAGGDAAKLCAELRAEAASMREALACEVAKRKEATALGEQGGGEAGRVRYCRRSAVPRPGWPGEGGVCSTTTTVLQLCLPCICPEFRMYIESLGL